MIPFKINNDPKSNYLTATYTNKFGKTLTKMQHKTLYTCEESKAMQDYENGIALFLDGLLKR